MPYPQRSIDYDGTERIIRRKHNCDGDAKRHEPIVGEKTIQGRLNRQHQIFDGTVGTASVIVITSYSTFTERHGPSVQKRWRVNKHHWSKTESDHKMDELDPRWPDRLDNMFGFRTTFIVTRRGKRKMSDSPD